MKYEHQKCFWIDINVRILDFPIRFDLKHNHFDWLDTNCVFGWMFCSCCLLWWLIVQNILLLQLLFWCYGYFRIHNAIYAIWPDADSKLILINGKPHFITEFLIVSIGKHDFIKKWSHQMQHYTAVARIKRVCVKTISLCFV